MALKPKINGIDEIKVLFPENQVSARLNAYKWYKIFQMFKILFYTITSLAGGLEILSKIFSQV